MGYVNKTYLSTQFKNFADKIAKIFSKIGHTHLKSDITDFPTSMPANGGNAATVGGHTVGVNVPSNAKFTDTTYSKLSEFTDDVGYVKNTDARLTDARNAKDVYAWAKASTKPTYTASEVGAVPISGGTVNGAITFGKNDAYGIRTNTDNYGRIGDATNQFYEVYANTIYENKIKLSEKYAGKSAATQSAQGLMSAADKKKLDGIASGATANPGTVTQVNVGTSTYYPSSGIIHLPAYPTSLPATGDSKDCTVTFTSGDSSTGNSTPPAVITSGETHKSLFNKLSTAVKNVRWLLSKMGTTDISSIGNGTVTGALSTLNSRIVVQTFVSKGLGYNFVFISNNGYIAAIYNNKRSLNGASVVAYTFDDATNVYDVWFDTVLNTTDSVELTVIWIKW